MPGATLKAKILLPGNLPSALWYHVPQKFISEVKVGKLVEVQLINKPAHGLVVELSNEDFDFKTKPVLNTLENQLPFENNYLEFLKWISEYYQTPLPLVFQSAVPKSAFKSLLPLKRKFQVKTQESAELEFPKEFTSEQSAVLNKVLPCLESGGKFASFLVHGVTGSGKTLVYLELAKKTLALGKNVLVLLPEIALTPKTINMFKSYLDEEIHPYHSALSAGERRSLWSALSQKKARVVVGVRSSVLCPLDDIGLIVVDEEHDGSFKQSNPAPRYNARDLALFRGTQFNCPVVLGTATPSLESNYWAEKGKHNLIQMKNRATQASLPEITIVDMKEQLELQGDIPLSIPLREEMDKQLAEGGQIILLLNRRGFSKVRLDKKTGEPIHCPNCSVPIIPHKSEKKLICHHCGHAQSADFSLNADTIDVGWAIEQLEEYLQSIYPEVKTLRLDRDSTSKLGSLNEILEEFESGKAKILIGTQMVAKGHDFKNVNLVGILDADSGLGLPDFRAQERIFQLITQVSGRAGRHSQTGKVFLQTFNPNNPVIQMGLKNDYENFYHQEINIRKELNYPPYCRMFKVEMTGKDEETVWQSINSYANLLSDLGAKMSLEILGPGQAAIRKINKEYRAQVFGKAGSPSQLSWVLKTSLENFSPQKKSTIKLTVDVDPVSVM